MSDSDRRERQRTTRAAGPTSIREAAERLGRDIVHSQNVARGSTTECERLTQAFTTLIEAFARQQRIDALEEAAKILWNWWEEDHPGESIEEGVSAQIRAAIERLKEKEAP